MQISQLYLDTNDYDKWQQLLSKAGLRPEQGLDESWGLFESDKLIATGSRQGNILKCLAVDPEYQGGKAFDLIIAQLLQSVWHYQTAKREQLKSYPVSERSSIEFTAEDVPGWDSVFAYTTAVSAQSFTWFGFEILESVGSQLIFMERTGESGGLQNYLKYLTTRTLNSLAASDDELLLNDSMMPVSAIVMHANPFTLGHLYLAGLAAEESSLVHLFILSEESPDFPPGDRFRMAQEATSHISNLIIHPTGPYLVSSATFPSYFIQAEDEVTTLHAQLDARIFLRHIAPALSIQRRYLGTEPLSKKTNMYNEAIRTVFAGELDLVIVPRLLSADGQPVSASTVRRLYKVRNWQELAKMVPPSTRAYLREHHREQAAQSEKDMSQREGM